MFDRCHGTVKARGFCAAHYRRNRLGVDLLTPLKGSIKVCTVAGCERTLYAKLMCCMHYGRVRLSGEVGAAEPKRHHKVGRWLDQASGYVYLEPWVTGTKRMAEHRFVMQGIVGRPLEAFENVHHKNGRRDDNSPGNLELWVKPQAAGQRVEDLVAWVIEHYPTFIQDALSRQPSALP